MPNMCHFEKRHFLTRIDLNHGFGKTDTFLKKFSDGTNTSNEGKYLDQKKFHFHAKNKK